ncbi:Apm1 protein [Pichia kluyveri]|uniref:Apm1 protein n=1 Tax=Pichia kluyveri TaxID=36015 RepID=A0AAV5RAW3_PICKL|nr:Apm1 protein [Pichia kluyveri]
MASIVAFLDSKARLLLLRDYKGDIPVSVIDEFPLLLLKQEQGLNNSSEPIIYSNGISYTFIQNDGIYTVGISKCDVNVFTILVFLSKLNDALIKHFKKLNEFSIKDNYSIIYELLDEMMDFGIPQITDDLVLKDYITQQSITFEKLISNVSNSATSTHRKIKQSKQDRRAPPTTITNQISWRKEGLKYKKNEAYLDVIESIDMLINSRGQMLTSEIYGKIKLKSYLSGMPELQLGLNEKFINSGLNSIKGLTSDNINNESITKSSIEVEDVKFHQCVQLEKFENDKIITFIPPDGECDLITYRVHSDILKPLFLIEYKFKNHSNTRLEIMVKVRANFKNKISANKVEIRIPVPEEIDSPKFHYQKGKLKYLPDENTLRWKFHKIEGGKEYVMIAELMLLSLVSESELKQFRKIPLNIKFEMQGFVTSGLQVRYLKIHEPHLNYNSYPYVRYITRSGDNYEIRSSNV